MSILNLPHAIPRVLLFDWHATLVDTHDAMYHAVNDVLPKLEELGLADRIIPAEDSKTIDDAKLVIYVRQYLKLHPKVVEARKISRTDIFEILFGNDEEAKHLAHKAFHHAYRDHYGKVTPFEEAFPGVLGELKAMGLSLGVLTNRDREFMEHEIDAVGESGWRHFFDTMVCGDDVARRKPAPDSIFKALENLAVKAGSRHVVHRRQHHRHDCRQARRRNQHFLQRRRLEPGLAGQDLPRHHPAPLQARRRRQQTVWNCCRWSGISSTVRAAINGIRLWPSKSSFRPLKTWRKSFRYCIIIQYPTHGFQP